MFRCSSSLITPRNQRLMLSKLKESMVPQPLNSRQKLLRSKLQQQRTTKELKFHALLDLNHSPSETVEVFLNSPVQMEWSTLACSSVNPLLLSHKDQSSVQLEPNHQPLISKIHSTRNAISMSHSTTPTSH